MSRFFIPTLTIMALSAAAALAEPSGNANAVMPVDAATETRATIDTAIRDLAASDPALSIRETDTGEVDAMVMLSDVLFEFGASELGNDAQATLKSIAHKMSGLDQVTIVGHTDSVGPESGNFSLGMARATAVRDWLINEGGMPSERLAVMSEGETAPIAANTTESGDDNAQGRALNRRVEFKFKEPANTETTQSKPQQLSQTHFPARNVL